MICKKKIIYLKNNKAKQTFAYTPNIGQISEGLFRIYTSCTQLEVRNLINNRKNFVEKLELRNGKWICFSSSLANEIC